MNKNIRDIVVPNDWDRRGLPAWSYHNEALLALEKQHVFREHWQIACHISDLPDAGSYMTLDVVGERALIIRDRDGQVRGFYNSCRHRGSRLVNDEKGICPNALVCPFHGWVYNLDGTLRRAMHPEFFPPLEKNDFGLIGLDLEVWMGFVFIRFAPGPQPSVAEVMRPFETEISQYRLEDIVPTNGVSRQLSPVNWKSVRDVDNEGYHVAMAHPALQDLYGSTYFDEPFVNGVSRSFATYNPHAGRRWSVRNYVNIAAPEQTWLPEHLRNAWGYYGLFPNAVLAVTPETVQFYQEFPVSVGQTIQRGAVYRRKEESRAQRVARYLSMRIDRDTSTEDAQLTIWSNESMTSKAFTGFYLSDLEYTVRSHHDHLRAILPVLTLDYEPNAQQMFEINAELKQGGERKNG